jgi:predicted Zn-dependent protease
MNAETEISPLRIANEAFMVAATIERCPRQMMLRELVMNALEAAAQATDAAKKVRIDTVDVNGAPKLRIWNTGRGLSQAELLQISDLSSSLFKTVSLDGNFGMGAKAASLSSNKLGLRYRSCRLGRVSQIVLGARGGVYGRVLQADPTGAVGRSEAIDITAASLAVGEDNSHDWTEVTLFGNAPDQNTALDPYAGDPVMPRDWVQLTLGRRFVRLPEGVELAIEPAASGAATREIFAPPLAPHSFDRMEAVSVEGGVVIHYGYRSKDSTLPAQSVGVVGLGAVVYDGEVYALTDDRRWALEAPTYGFTFAAKQCSVIVELPHAFGARPEQYRQFLRFVEGDQHQVQFADFGDLVRRNIPAWLKNIIQSLLPRESDYLAEIRDELRRLLVELRLEDLLRAPQPRKPADTHPTLSEPAPQTEANNSPPPPPPPPPPPEIITIEDEDEIVEKALGGRAARYYPATRQVFVNARYAAFARMSAQLFEEFATFADEATVRHLAKVTAEWAVIQRIARTLLHSIAKPKSGWTTDEIKTAQSPETMSLMVDDIDPLLVPARRRIAAQLGLSEDTDAKVGFGGDTSAQRAASELAEAEAQLQRAKAGNVRSLGPYYRQVGTLHIRQRNYEAARAWLEKGMAVDPADPWCRNEYISLLLAENEVDRAAEVIDQSLAGASENPALFHRRSAEIETRRGNLGQAEALLTQAAAEDEESPWAHYELAALHLRQDRLDEAAAAADAALACSSVPSAVLLRRRAEIDLRRGNRAAATKLLEQGRALDPRDPWIRQDLANLAAAEGRFEAAIREIDAALEGPTTAEPWLHRARSVIEMQRGNRAQALAAAHRAVRANPSEPWCQHQLSEVLMAIGDLDRAAEATAEALRVAPTPSPILYRRLGEIEGRRGNRAGALAFLDQALALAPNEPWTWLEVAAQRTALGDLAGADQAAATAAANLQPPHKAHALRVRAQIAFKQKNFEAASAFLREAMDLAPTDPWSRLEAADQLLANGEPDAALTKVKEAMLFTPTPRASMLIRAATIEERRGNHGMARVYLQQAIAAEPDDPHPWSMLANLLTTTGDLPGAREAAEKATEIASGNREKILEAHL